MGTGVEAGDGTVMVYRYSWVAGAGAIVFAMWRLSELLRPTPSGAKWQFVVLAAFSIGLIVTWTALAYRLKARWVALLNLVLFVAAASRYGAPDTGWLILPGPDTLATVSAQLERAIGIIRHGIEPVQPIPGMVIVLGGLFWLLGSLMSLGLSKDRPFVALIPPLVVGLQLITIDRQPSSTLEAAVFVLLVAGTALAVGLDEHERGAGRMAKPGHHPSTRRAAPLSATAFALVALAVTGAVGLSSAASGRVPSDGFVEWRAPGGLAAGVYGGVAYNPYVSIRQGLVSQEHTPLFSARLDGDIDPFDVYFRMVTLDTYDNGRWLATDSEAIPASESHYEDAGGEYAGITVPVDAAVTIHNLRQDWLPVPYAVIGVDGAESESFEVRTTDRSVRFAGNRTFSGMQYRVAAGVPTIDSGAIVADADGGLSPLFAVAVEQGAAVPLPDPAAEHRQLPDPGRYLELPADIDPGIKALAAGLTSRLDTAFEKGLALEYWFRETGGFRYDIDVDTGAGHNPNTLAAWLLDDSPENLRYRRGYCEQFATSMGVMARSVGIPTRVVLGFTPGEPVGDNEVLVTDLNGHSWVELWIPSQGWMRFDPTPRSDQLNPNPTYRRLETELGFDVAAYLGLVPEPVREPSDPGASAGLGPRPEIERGPIPRPTFGEEGGGGSTSLIIILIGIAAAALGGIPAAKWARRRSRLRRLADGEVAAAWEEIVARLADLDRTVDPASTPREVAASVDEAMEPLAAVYGKAVYGPAHALSGSDVEVASRSMTATAERLTDGLSAQQRVRATYRLTSLIGRRNGVIRWLPWPRR
jgi:transglutaminase-like putative cysteine protease